MRSVKLDPADGSPALYINGKKMVPIFYGLSDIPASKTNTAQAQKNIAAFAKEGVSVVSVDTNLNLGWHKATGFEYEAVQAEIAGALEANPEARILLRLHLNPPYWWMRDNPEECALYESTPGIDDGENQRLIRNDQEHHLRVSLGSQKFLKDAGDRLAILCRELSDTPEGEALIGVQVACGFYGEWHQWGTDCSAPMRKRFVRFLQEKYGTVENLQAAWHDETVTFETAVYAPSVTPPGDVGVFRDPAKSQYITDSQQCLQRVVPEAIVHFCKIVKENFKGDILAGAFYGYYKNLSQDTIVIDGHLFPQVIYENRQYVDFLCGPFAYSYNRRSDGFPLSRGLLESSRLRDVLWLTEMDQHPIGTESYVGGDPAYRGETIALMRRNILLPFLSGMGAWYYDHRIVPGVQKLEGITSMGASSIFLKKGWWDHPELMDEVGNIQRLAERCLNIPYRGQADVLIVYDTNTHFHQSRFPDKEFNLQDSLCHAGIMSDCIYLEELEIAELDRYKLIILANAHCLSEEKRENIHRLTAGRNVMWMYASGFCDEKTLDVENIAKTTGMKAEIIEPEYAYDTVEGKLPKAEIVMTDPVLDPVFAICDEEAEPLARYKKSGKCAAARKGRTYWFALPLVDRDIIGAIAEEVGVHRYNRDGDPVIAGRGVVAVNTMTPGEKTIYLRNGKEVHCTLPGFFTAVFDDETGERLL